MNKHGIDIVFHEKVKCPRIIAISGKLGTGKDTLYEALYQKLNSKPIEICPEQLRFAGSLKEACSIISGTKLEDNYSNEGKGKHIESLGMSIGKFQQLLGTVAREHIHPDIWIIPILEKCKNNPYNIHVITDCRFPNEVKRLQEIGAVAIRLNRRQELISEKCVAGRDLSHQSEIALDNYTDFDLIINNNGTKEDMIDSAFNFLNLK